jgi:hypothetical protein
MHTKLKALVFVELSGLALLLTGAGLVAFTDTAAWAATAGSLPLTAPLTVIIRSLQGAGGLFIAIKSIWLGVTWRQRAEHGTDEFTSIGISAALIAGAEVFGQAVGLTSGATLLPMPLPPLNEVVGDGLSALLYLQAIMTPALLGWRHLRKGRP